MDHWFTPPQEQVTPMALRLLLSLNLFSALFGQVSVQVVHGGQYRSFVSLTKKQIKEITTTNKNSTWILQTHEAVDTFYVRSKILDFYLDSVALDSNGYEPLDTLRIVDHRLLFDSSSICILDLASYNYTREKIAYEAFHASRDLAYHWRKAYIADLYVSKYKHKLTMKIDTSTYSPKMLITYCYLPLLSKAAYQGYFSGPKPARRKEKGKLLIEHINTHSSD